MLNIIFNETQKQLRLTWSYRFNTLATLATLAITFLGILFFMGNGELPRDRMPAVLIGYTMWYLALKTISTVSNQIYEEARTGTLEQTLLGPLDFTFILFGRILGVLLWAGVEVTVLVVGLVLLDNVKLPLRWEALPVFGLGLLEVTGIGFIIGGMMMALKNIFAFSIFLQNALLFLNGSLVPMDRLPAWLAAIGYLLPTTRVIVVLRNILLSNQSLMTTWQNGSLPALIIHTAVYLVGGIAIFKWCERYARQQGTLGQY